MIYEIIFVDWRKNLRMLIFHPFFLIFAQILAFSDGKNIKVMLPAQDHKQVFENDKGANTGGMGAFAPCPLVYESMLEWISTNVIQKAVDGLRQENIPFVGEFSLVW